MQEKEQYCISVSSLEVAGLLTLIQLFLQLLPQASSLSTTKIRTCCSAQSMTMQYFQNSTHASQGTCMYMCVVPGLHRPFLEEEQILGYVAAAMQASYIKGISKIQGSFRPKWLVLYFALLQLYVSLITALSKIQDD